VDDGNPLSLKVSLPRQGPKPVFLVQDLAPDVPDGLPFSGIMEQTHLAAASG
jgi:hypothetical protein